MNKTIHQLDEIEGLATSDEIPIWDNSTSGTKKVPASEIKSLVITATSTTVTGAKLMSGSVVKILFTSAITGSDTTTGLSISYNGTSYAVKVGKNGSLVNLVAHDVSGTYTYLQAYTTLELAFDGTQFIVIGNPVVISNSDYTIYADGQRIDTIFQNNIDISSGWSLISAESGNIALQRRGNIYILNCTFVLVDNSAEYTQIAGCTYAPTSQNDVRFSVVSTSGRGYRGVFNSAGQLYLVSPTGTVAGDAVSFQIVFSI